MSDISPPSTSTAPVNRHALTAVEKQRSQLERLLKDPLKPAYIPAPPKEKTVRPPREMMKNVQGSSAGAGSGEFHVYKASRRREYERLKLLEEASTKEAEEAEFERKRRAMEEASDAKTAKNRAKRQKKKERAKGKNVASDDGGMPKDGSQQRNSDFPMMKKRRLVNGEELVFKKPGDGSDDDDDDDVDGLTPSSEPLNATPLPAGGSHGADHTPIAETSRITIVEDD